MELEVEHQHRYRKDLFVEHRTAGSQEEPEEERPQELVRVVEEEREEQMDQTDSHYHLHREQQAELKLSEQPMVGSVQRPGPMPVVDAVVDTGSVGEQQYHRTGWTVVTKRPIAVTLPVFE